MRKLSFFALFLMLSASAHAEGVKRLIISDVDDTIKLTNVLATKPTIVFNGLFRETAFSGMSELYQEFSDPDTSIVYISGSPQAIRSRVKEFLEENEFPQKNQLILRSSVKEDIIEYKLESIRKMIRATKPEKIILIGDDTEHDPEIYETIASEYSSKVDGIYIRAIQNRELPNVEGLKNFFSPVEIATNELLKGNLAKDSVLKVARGFILQTNDSKLSISKRYCPSLGRKQLEDAKAQIRDEDLIKALDRSQSKIIRHCD